MESEIKNNTKEKKVKKKSGRPPKYDYDTLKKILLKYAAENKGGEITISKLVKYSGLPIQAWRFNKAIRADISKLNTMKGITYDNVIDLGLPNAEDLINMNYKNKDRLIKAVSELIEVCQHSYSEISKLRKYEEELKNTKHELESYKQKIHTFKKEIEFYKNEMIKMSLKTSTSIGRDEIGIEENLIDLKKYSETKTTYKDLFED